MPPGGPIRRVSESSAERIKALLAEGLLSLSDARAMVAASERSVPLTVAEACKRLPGADPERTAEACRLADVQANRRLGGCDPAAVEDLGWLLGAESPLGWDDRWPWHPGGPDD